MARGTLSKVLGLAVLGAAGYVGYVYFTDKPKWCEWMAKLNIPWQECFAPPQMQNPGPGSGSGQPKFQMTTVQTHGVGILPQPPPPTGDSGSEVRTKCPEGSILYRSVCMTPAQYNNTACRSLSDQWIDGKLSDVDFINELAKAGCL